jgi:hypothetical protein
VQLKPDPQGQPGVNRDIQQCVQGAGGLGFGRVEAGRISGTCGLGRNGHSALHSQAQYRPSFSSVALLGFLRSQGQGDGEEQEEEQRRWCSLSAHIVVSITNYEAIGDRNLVLHRTDT